MRSEGEVALLGAPGCVQTVVTEQRRQHQQQSGSGEERSGAMPKRFPLREREKERDRQERERKHREAMLVVITEGGKDTLYT